MSNFMVENYWKGSAWHYTCHLRKIHVCACNGIAQSSWRNEGWHGTLGLVCITTVLTDSTNRGAPCGTQTFKLSLDLLNTCPHGHVMAHHTTTHFHIGHMYMLTCCDTYTTIDQYCADMRQDVTWLVLWQWQVISEWHVVMQSLINVSVTTPLCFYWVMTRGCGYHHFNMSHHPTC